MYFASAASSCARTRVRGSHGKSKRRGWSHKGGRCRIGRPNTIDHSIGVMLGHRLGRMLCNELCLAGFNPDSCLLVVRDRHFGIFQPSNRVLIHCRSQNPRQDCWVEHASTLRLELSATRLKVCQKSGCLGPVCQIGPRQSLNVVHQASESINRPSAAQISYSAIARVQSHYPSTSCETQC